MKEKFFINARIIDGTGLASFHGEIGIINDLIVDRGIKLGNSKNVYNEKLYMQDTRIKMFFFINK